MRNINTNVRNNINDIIDSAVYIKDHLDFLRVADVPAGQIVISMTAKAIHVNNVEIANLRKSYLQFQVFKVLIAQHVDNFVSCKHAYITSSRIAQLINRSENTVWKTMYTLRVHMKNKNIREGIIESSKWSGYKLSKHVMFKLL